MNPTTLRELKDAASVLPAKERAELAEFLLQSLDELDEATARAEWLALAKCRIAEIENGIVAGIPAEIVLKTLLEPRQ